jgi:predicted AAA+ superfamily ATPase
MIHRIKYLEQIGKFKDDKTIKVIQGIRGSGKSTFVKQYISLLKRFGIEDDKIFYFNFEFKNAVEIDAYFELREEILQSSNTYVFLDEVQDLKIMKEVILELATNPNIDLYLITSKKTKFPKELQDNYNTILFQGLSFNEYLNGQNTLLENRFQQYIKNSSFPYVETLLQIDDGLVDNYLITNIYNMIVKYDNKFKEEHLDNIKILLKYLDSHINEYIDTNLASEELNIEVKLIKKYLSKLTSSYLLYEIKDFNLKKRKKQTKLSKYYFADLAILNAAIGKIDFKDEKYLANFVVLELLSKPGLLVSSSKPKNIDLVLLKNNAKLFYYQILPSLLEEDKLNSIIADYEQIPDFNRKLIVTNGTSSKRENQIELVNLLSWLTRQ